MMNKNTQGWHLASVGLQQIQKGLDQVLEYRISGGKRSLLQGGSGRLLAAVASVQHPINTFYISACLLSSPHRVFHNE